MRKTAARTIDEYIGSFPADVRKILQALRKTIRKAAPEAEEKIRYQMPAFTFHGNLVYFAAWKDHIGFYPTPSAINAFRKELSNYEMSRGTVQFPIDKPIPLRLITKMVKFRVQENRERMKQKQGGRNSG